MKQKDMEAMLKNWIIFNKKLLTWSIDELNALLKYEEANNNRSTFVKRLKQRIVQAHKEKMQENM